MDLEAFLGAQLWLHPLPPDVWPLRSDDANTPCPAAGEDDGDVSGDAGRVILAEAKCCFLLDGPMYAGSSNRTNSNNDNNISSSSNSGNINSGNSSSNKAWKGNQYYGTRKIPSLCFSKKTRATPATAAATKRSQLPQEGCHCPGMERSAPDPDIEKEKAQGDGGVVEEGSGCIYVKDSRLEAAVGTTLGGKDRKNDGCASACFKSAASEREGGACSAKTGRVGLKAEFDFGLAITRRRRQRGGEREAAAAAAATAAAPAAAPALSAGCDRLSAMNHGGVTASEAAHRSTPERHQRRKEKNEEGDGGGGGCGRREREGSEGRRGGGTLLVRIEGNVYQAEHTLIRSIVYPRGGESSGSSNGFNNGLDEALNLGINNATGGQRGVVASPPKSSGNSNIKLRSPPPLTTRALSLPATTKIRGAAAAGDKIKRGRRAREAAGKGCEKQYYSASDLPPTPAGKDAANKKPVKDKADKCSGSSGGDSGDGSGDGSEKNMCTGGVVIDRRGRRKSSMTGVIASSPTTEPMAGQRDKSPRKKKRKLAASKFAGGGGGVDEGGASKAVAAIGTTIAIANGNGNDNHDGRQRGNTGRHGCDYFSDDPGREDDDIPSSCRGERFAAEKNSTRYNTAAAVAVRAENENENKSKYDRICALLADDKEKDPAADVTADAAAAAVSRELDINKNKNKNVSDSSPPADYKNNSTATAAGAAGRAQDGSNRKKKKDGGSGRSSGSAVALGAAKSGLAAADGDRGAGESPDGPPAVLSSAAVKINSNNNKRRRREEGVENRERGGLPRISGSSGGGGGGGGGVRVRVPFCGLLFPGVLLKFWEKSKNDASPVGGARAAAVSTMQGVVGDLLSDLAPTVDLTDCPPVIGSGGASARQQELESLAQSVVAEGRGDGFRMRREAWDDFVHGSHTLLLADGGDGSLQHRGCNRSSSSSTNRATAGGVAAFCSVSAGDQKEACLFDGLGEVGRAHALTSLAESFSRASIPSAVRSTAQREFEEMKTDAEQRLEDALDRAFPLDLFQGRDAGSRASTVSELEACCSRVRAAREALLPLALLPASEMLHESEDGFP